MSYTSIKSIFEDTEQKILANGIKIESKETGRPWGGYFVIQENSADTFIQKYFKNNTDVLASRRTKNISPKILLVAPDARLSWQYHNRRSEIWKVVEGPVGIVTSENDNQGKQETLETGDTVKLHVGLRHRLIGLNNWGIVAEIWIHEDTDHPSNEHDIVRLNDDYGR
jgi:mannose-6-phosphate isomerase-like protein (cupin superfamily)